ncbi:hypothetical protein FGG08_002805 [Glutinoglossum americanum]|uniref:P-loop containing nucleoside triphosphate hydrolase protein n=1 Tax=Glutinoglossum americanum TaxID=1670608 RepID=A0A9P8IAZ5_9PEZI|nr:hypothetical protein FGG08_002805 [Glutinoglossum americanum]
MPLLANKRAGNFATSRKIPGHGLMIECQTRKYSMVQQVQSLAGESNRVPHTEIFGNNTIAQRDGNKSTAIGQPSVPSPPPKSQKLKQRLPKGLRNAATNRQKAGGKRAVDPTTRLPPARRQHQSGSTRQLIDEQHIHNTFDLPTKEDYPHAPPSLFTQPSSFIFNTSYLRSRRETHCLHGIWRCTVTSQITDRPSISAIGEGRSKSNAEKAACLHVIAKLHHSGTLKEAYSDANDTTIDKQTLQSEADAKEDVYNYAARFGCIPTFSVRTVQIHKRGRSRRSVEVTIELPEQGIKVAMRGVDLRVAEIGASIMFKREAERYHAAHGSDNIVIRDSNVLNTGNAGFFIDFYKIMNPGTTVEATLSSAKHLNAFKWFSSYRGQVLINNEPVGDPVDMIGKGKAEQVAFLTAAIAIAKEDDELFHQFLRTPKAANGAVLKPLAPVTMRVDSDCVLTMIDTLGEARNRGLPDEKEDVAGDDETNIKRLRTRVEMNPALIPLRNRELQKKHEAYMKNPDLEILRAKKEGLPMNQYRAKVIDLVKNNAYSIIVGATGSGKTTQVPQILLEDAISGGFGTQCNIICTQPRRIAATSVARRVAVERNEALQNTVGYHVRFDAKLPRFGGSISYCTTGILLSQLQHGADATLDGISHLIIDEVHERDILIDFLLIVLKNVQKERERAGKPTPKVILMSATLDTELFAGYFGHVANDGSSITCPLLSVPGRTFPVREYFLEEILETLKGSHPSNLGLLDPPTQEYLDVERNFIANPSATTQSSTSENLPDVKDSTIDWKTERTISSRGEHIISTEQEDALVPLGLVAATIAHIAKTTNEGAILVFLPGLAEIVKTEEILRSHGPLGIDFNDERAFKISKLHSTISADQTDVFNAVPPGCRKIILATNIAETSITIPDVQFVVDCGKLREKRYDQLRRITKLQCTWISKSNAKQRAGRAGRVQNGNYYALYSEKRYNSLRVIGLPEMLRSDLQEICLDIKSHGFKSSIRDVLAAAIEPPSPSAVDASVTELQGLDALTDDEKLTPLGKLLASLYVPLSEHIFESSLTRQRPVHPSLGKMIVLSVIFRCLDPILILGAASNERSLFVSPLERRKEAGEARNSFTQESGSDHIALINAFGEMRHIRASRGDHAMLSFARNNFLHPGAFRTIDNTVQQIETILIEAGLIPKTDPKSRFRFEYGDPQLNENSSSVPLIKALILAGTHPNLAVGTGPILYRTPNEASAMIHPSSTNYVAPKLAKGSSQLPTLLMYSSMAKSTDGNTLFLRETSETTPLTAALFGGRLLVKGRVIEMDFWLPFYVRADSRAIKAILEFKKGLDRLLTGTFNDLCKGRNGSSNFLADSPARRAFARGLVEVLSRDINAKESYGDQTNSKSLRFSQR